MAAKLKKSNNIVVRLRLKEMRGSLQPHIHAAPVKMFNRTIPATLVFNLKDLVPLSVLHDGHVFLGFTKDGQFMLSYTQLMETEAHTAYPYYVYHLHWWVLRPGTPQQRFKLHKVSQVRLFGEEEILTDIFLLVCQWPTDHSKVLVHGYSHQNGASSDDKCLCYLTVTAVPPAGPCSDCLQLPQHLDSPDVDDAPSRPTPPRCLQHGFTLHTKYELAPPFPPFHPKVSLKLDGVIVLNTADSLVALSIHTGGVDREESIQSGGVDREETIHTEGGDRKHSIESEGGAREVHIHSEDRDLELSIQTRGVNLEPSIHTERGDSELSFHDGAGDKEVPIQTEGVDREQSIHHAGDDKELSTGRVDGKTGSDLKGGDVTVCQGGVLASDGHSAEHSSDSDGPYVFNMTASNSQIQTHSGNKVVHTCLRCGSDSYITTNDKCSCAAEYSHADDVSGATHTRCSDAFTNRCNTCTAIDRCSNDTTIPGCTKCCLHSQAKESISQSEEVRRSDAVNVKYNSVSPGGVVLTDSLGERAADQGKVGQDRMPEGRFIFTRMKYNIRTGKVCQPMRFLPVPSISSNNRSGDSTNLDSRTPPGHGVSADLLSAASDSKVKDSTAPNSRTSQGHDLPSDLLSAALCSNFKDSTALDNKTPQDHEQPTDLLSAASDSSIKDSTVTAFNNRAPQGYGVPSHLLSAVTDSKNSTALDSRTPPDLLSAASDSSSWDSTALDCSRSPCFTFTRRQFVYSTTDLDDHNEDTGLGGSEYQSMLPLEVHGAGYSHMRLCMGEDRETTYFGQPGSVEVQELRMDAEQFICDMARQDADWGNRFVAFTDYDMQIIDVCPDSRQLVVLVLALVRARPHYGKCIPKLYQTSFTAAWDLSTGHHQTMDIQPLQEFDQAQLRKVWNPGRAMSRKLQHRWMIPQGYARGVHVMTNEAVFRGWSVSMLWDPTSCIAIIP